MLKFEDNIFQEIDKEVPIKTEIDKEVKEKKIELIEEKYKNHEMKIVGNTMKDLIKFKYDGHESITYHSKDPVDLLQTIATKFTKFLGVENFNVSLILY
jgi:hypothetical protein